MSTELVWRHFDTVTEKHTSKRLGLLGRHSAQVAQIALVADQHDDDVGVSVISQLLEPSRHVLVCLVLADVVYEECAHSTAIIGRRDGPVTFLASSIPDLRLDRFRVDLNGPRGELDADSGLGIKIELVSRESAKKIGLSNTRISDQNH